VPEIYHKTFVYAVASAVPCMNYSNFHPTGQDILSAIKAYQWLKEQ